MCVQHPMNLYVLQRCSERPPRYCPGISFLSSITLDDSSYQRPRVLVLDIISLAIESVKLKSLLYFCVQGCELEYPSNVIIREVSNEAHRYSKKVLDILFEFKYDEHVY